MTTWVSVIRMAGKQRPTGVAVLAILAAIGGILCLIVAAVLGILAGAMAEFMESMMAEWGSWSNTWRWRICGSDCDGNRSRRRNIWNFVPDSCLWSVGWSWLGLVVNNYTFGPRHNRWTSKSTLGHYHYPH